MGLRGFYAGWIPPFIGSILFRSTNWSIYDAVYSKYEKEPDSFMRKKIPFSGGIEWRTPFGGFCGGVVRSFIECPFEYAKTRR